MTLLHEITVSHVCPPVPSRAFDYQAAVADYEEDSPKGHGETPEAAHVDLVGHLSQDADPALADALIAMIEAAADRATLDGKSFEYVNGLRDAAQTIAGSMA